MAVKLVEAARAVYHKFMRLNWLVRAHIAQQLRVAKTTHGDDRARKLYKALEPYAYVVKIYAQMATGVLISLLLLLKFGLSIFGCAEHSWCSDLATKNTLALVGDGLMYSAGFELAYMLFTPGPDEAIEPVILGMAAAILIVISDDKIEWADAVIPLALVISIGFLFYLSKAFLPKFEKDEH